MAAGPSTFTKNNMLGAVFNSSAFDCSGAYVRVHSDDPGASGDANTIANVTGANGSSSLYPATAPASGAVTTSAVMSWTMSGGGTVKWVSVFDASSAGQHLWNVQLTNSGTYASGGVCRIYTGDLDFSVS